MMAPTAQRDQQIAQFRCQRVTIELPDKAEDDTLFIPFPILYVDDCNCTNADKIRTVTARTKPLYSQNFG